MTVEKTKDRLRKRFHLTHEALERYWQKAWREAKVVHKGTSVSPKVEAVRAIAIRMIEDDRKEAFLATVRCCLKRSITKPLPPHILADAIQDKAHIESGKGRIAKSTKVRL